MKDLNIPLTSCVMQLIRMKFQLNEFTDGQCTCEENGNIYEVNSDDSCLTFQQSTSALPAVTLHCQPGTAFDLHLCVCNYIAQVTCPAGCGIPTTTTPTTTTPTTTPPGMKSLNRSYKICCIS